MKSKNTRIARLKEMMALEEKRAVLKNNITTIDQRLSSIQNELYGAAARRAAAKEERKAQQKTKLGRKGRGELMNDILEILQVAGRAGVTVKDLANRIGVKTANIHSWFSTNLKKIAALKKVGEARYALNGKVEAKIAKKAKASKKVITKASGKKSRKTKAARGALKEQILSQLTQAGAEGVTIKDLSKKLKTNYRNLYVWFVTTGKRIPGIAKVGPAQYKFEAAA